MVISNALIAAEQTVSKPNQLGCEIFLNHTIEKGLLQYHTFTHSFIIMCLKQC